MKNLKMILSLVLSVLMTGCLSSGGSSSASSSPADGGGNGGIGGAASMKITAINRNQVSTFGGQVVLSLDSVLGTIQSVTQGAESLAFSVSGTDITVTIPEDETLGPITLVVQDSDGNTLAFDGVSAQVNVVAGMTIDTQVIVNNALGPSPNVNIANQKMLYVRNSTQLEWQDLSNNLTALDFQGLDFNLYDMGGFSFSRDGAQLYLTVQKQSDSSYEILRYNIDGSADGAFVISGLSASHVPKYLGEDATYVYFNILNTGTPANLNISRYAKADATLDVTFGTVGVVTISDSATCGTTIDLSMPKLQVLNNKLYFFASWTHGRYVFILNQADGSRVVTPDYYRGRQDFHCPDANFVNRDMILDGDSSAANIGSLFLDSDGSFYSFANSRILKMNSDLSASTGFTIAVTPADAAAADLKSIDYHAPFSFSGILTPNQGVSLSQIPAIQNEVLAQGEFSNILDFFKLPSGHFLIVYSLSVSGNSSTAQQICSVVVDSAGAPIRAMRQAPACQSIQYGADHNVTSAPDLQLIPNSDGSTHITTGNQYSYLFLSNKIWGVQFTIEE